MENIDQKLEEFFAGYEAQFNKALGPTPEVDVEATAGAFADCFVEASPLGVSCGKNDEQFRAVIPQGYEFYRSIGTKSMRIDSLAVTVLDDYHAMAKVHWLALYTKKGGGNLMLDFDVIYFVQTIDGKSRIFAYITGDEQKAYQESGLIAE